MSKFSAAFRYGAMVAACLATLACDGDPEPGPAGGAGGSGGTPDAAADASGGSRGDAAGQGARDAATEAPAQDLTPVTIERPVVVRRGSRLRGFFVQSSEGGQERWGLWDSMLNTRCSVTTAEDGKLRCLPPLPSGWALDSYYARYVDAGCTEPALPEAPDCASGFGFRLLATGRAIHRLGPATQVTTLYARSVVNGVSTCEAKPLAQPLRVFTLGEHLPPTMFVERLSNRTDGPQTQRIKPVYDELADGTRVLTVLSEAWDSDLEAYCRVYRADDGWMRCLPSIAMTGSSFAFSEDKCTRPAGFSTRETLEKFALLLDGTGCQTRRRAFRVPAGATPLTTIYRIVGERCTAFPQTTTGVKYYALGEELPPERFAAFRPARVGNGRLQERYFVGEEGVAVRETTALWDTQLSQLCNFDLTSSGRRCIPPGWGGQYADATCATTRLGLPGAQLCGEPAAATPMNSLSAGPWCAPRAVAHALGGAVSPPDGGVSNLYVRSLDNSCTQFSTSTSGWRSLGDAIDLNMFVPGTETMD
jgi:hypothetical protein